MLFKRNYLFVYLLLLSHIAIAQFGGPASSRKMKKSIVNSFLFENSDLFYPNGLPENPLELPDLSAKQVKKLSKTLDKLNVFLYKTDDQIKGVLSKHFNVVDVDAKFKGIKILQRDIAVFNTTSTNYLFMDLKVLQAIFAAALIESVDDPKLNDQEKMKRFFEFKEKVKGSKSFGVIGDLFGDLDSPWFNMSDYVDESHSIEMRYLSTMLFTMSHELGHLSLRHFDNIDQSDTLKNHKMEFDADAFAVLMMTGIFQNQLLLDGFGFRNYSFRTLIGDEIFFNKAFYLAEFKQNLLSHPPVEARKKRIEELYDSLFTDRDDH